ncbi:MAG: ribosomal protein L7/L12 [Archangiaceae bacterium]|nr:ribosomal protein L7/L12 [Archangiaceae bacterium]
MRVLLFPLLLLSSVAAAQDAWSVALTEVGPNKILVIKEVRTATGLGLKEAKDLVEAPMPQSIKKGVTRETADALVAAFEKAGAKVEVLGLKSPGRPKPTGTAVEGSYSVRLESFGSAKIACIKEVRLATGLGLAETKKLVESAPVFVKEGLSKEQAETLVKALVAAGGTASAVLLRK